MEPLFRWQNRNPIEDLTELEAALRAALKPVTPRQSFVVDLQQRLMQELARASQVARISPVHLVLVVAGALLTVSVLLLASARLIMTIIGLVHLLNQPPNR